MKGFARNCTVNLKNAGMKRFSWILVFLLISHHSMSQIKGKARHLDGVWRYEGGSGYEIWSMNNNGQELVGSGYRLSKFGDTIRVEDLRISRVSGNNVYSLTTRQRSENGEVVNKYVFVAKGKRLDFANTENSMPNGIHYRFGLFSKKRMKIIIRFDGEERVSKLKLRKVERIDPVN
jgi:hypothetical protein